MSQLIEASKTEQFGNDAQTNNLIALFIMVGTTLVCIIAGTKGGHILAGVIAGLTLFLALGIMFTLMGWLSAFILFGIFMVLLVGIIFVVMISSGN